MVATAPPEPGVCMAMDTARLDALGMVRSPPKHARHLSLLSPLSFLLSSPLSSLWLC